MQLRLKFNLVPALASAIYPITAIHFLAEIDFGHGIIIVALCPTTGFVTITIIEVPGKTIEIKRGLVRAIMAIAVP